MRPLPILLLCVLVAAAPPQYPDHAKLLIHLDSESKEHRVENVVDWRKRRADILASLQLVMGNAPPESRKVPLDVRVLGEEDLPSFVRRKLTFATETGDRVPAYLLIPHGLRARTAAVLCLHQTTAVGKGEPAGVAGKASLHYAAHLAERGYVTLAPDYPGFGDYRFNVYEHGYASTTMKAIWNHMRAVDLLQTLAEVDPQRIGCIGHSLGGHNTLFLAVFDDRIRVAVSNCGFTSFPKYYRGNLTGWTGNNYMPRIATVYHKDPKQVPFDFPEVIAAVAPRPLLAIAPMRDDNFEVSGVRDCISAATPVYQLLAVNNRLAAFYPECEHDFPPESRKAAYEWIDRWLRE